MTDRKWNNQGGSSRDGFSFKKYKPVKKDAIPSFEDLKESQVTSFRVAKPRRARPNYGQFGDAVWVYDFYDDDLTIKEPEIDVPEIKEPSDEIPDTYIRNVDPENKSTDIFPYSIEDEYELVVKFGSLKLYISSGQAFAARNDINDPKFDLSLVIESSQPISFDNRSPTLINTISLRNSAQNPIYSLYEWLLSKLAIVTDYSAENPDPVLSALRLNGQVLRLPDTDFMFNNQQHGLFYSEGKQPDQICLHAINKVLKFDRSRNPEEGNWLVTYAGEELALCLDLNPDPQLPTVFIQFSFGSLQEIESGNNGQFASIKVFVSQLLAADLNVFVGLSGTADLAFINVDEVVPDTVSAIPVNGLKFTIQSGDLFTEARITANIDRDQIGDKSVIASILPNGGYQVVSEQSSVVTTIKLPKPIVSIVFSSGSPTDLRAGNGAFFAYVSRDYILNAPLDIDLAFTGDAAFDEYRVDNFGFSDRYQVQIPSGEAGVVVKIEPNTTNLYDEDRSIIASVIPSQSNNNNYAIDQTKEFISMTILKQQEGKQYIVVRQISTITNAPIDEQLRENKFTRNNGIMVSGSNASLTTLSSPQIDYDFPSNLIEGDREYLLDRFDEASPYLNNYGIPENYYRRYATTIQPNSQDNMIDFFLSKDLLKAFLTARSKRYLLLINNVSSPIVVDRRPDIPFSTSFLQRDPMPLPIEFDIFSTAASNPLFPNTEYEQFFNKSRISFGQLTDGTVPNSDNFDYTQYNNSIYADEIDKKFASGFINPIQIDNFGSLDDFTVGNGTPPNETVDVYSVGSTRLFWKPCGIEFDFQTDPDLENPRIVPVLTRQLRLTVNKAFNAPSSPFFPTPYNQLQPG